MNGNTVYNNDFLTKRRFFGFPFCCFKDMEAEVTAYRAEPDPVEYSSADGEADDDEPVSFIVFFSTFRCES